MIMTMQANAGIVARKRLKVRCANLMEDLHSQPGSPRRRPAEEADHGQASLAQGVPVTQ